MVLALALAVAALLAVRSMTRTTDRDADRDQTLARMARAQAALEQYAAAYQRLPCPADPSQSSGIEVPTLPLVNLCTNLTNLGTLPWATLGLRSEDGLDRWGVKLSYAVANPGGLLPPVVAGGLNMADCDTTKSGPVDLSGKCDSLHTTGPNQFLLGKTFLTVRDESTVFTNGAAYVIVSHGPTGQGGFLTNNSQRALSPNNRERSNALPGTTFYSLPWSGSDVEASDNAHFDDLVVYRTFSELVAKIGLAARPWRVQDIPGQVASATFNATTIGAALNRTVSPGDLGIASLTMGNLTVGTLFSPNLGLATITLSDGSTASGIGIAGGGGAVLSSNASGTTNGVFGFQFGQPVRFIGVALAGFGAPGGFAERVQFNFFNVVGGIYNPAGNSGPVTRCALVTGDYVTFSIQAPANFNAVQIQPLPSKNVLNQSGSTAFLVSQAIACDGTATACYPPSASNIPLNKC